MGAALGPPVLEESHAFLPELEAVVLLHACSVLQRSAWVRASFPCGTEVLVPLVAELCRMSSVLEMGQEVNAALG